MEPVNDPLGNFFGPELGNGPINNLKYPSSPKDDENAPEELVSAFEEFGLDARSYRCILKCDDGDKARNCYIQSYNNSYPTIDTITKEYGPGRYQLTFTWRHSDPAADGKMRNATKTVEIEVSERAQEVYDEYQWYKRIQNRKNRIRKVQETKLDVELDAQLENSAYGQNQQSKNVDPIEAGKEYVKMIKESSEALGLVRNQGINLEKILGIVTPFIPVISQLFLNKQQQSEKLMMLLLNQSNESSKQMLELVKNTQGSGAGQNAVKEFKDMLSGVIDIKQALTGDKVTVADRIFSMIEGVAPKILEVAALSQSQRMANTQYLMAKGMMSVHPDLQKLGKDQGITIETIHKLDDKFGWEQTDKILMAVDIDRPQECPKDPVKRFHCEHPSRNNPEAFNDDTDPENE